MNLVRGLHDAGHDVTVLAQYWGSAVDNFYRDGPPLQLTDGLVIGVQRFGEENGGDFESDVRRLIGMITQLHRARRFDVLHAQFAYPPGLAVLEAGRRLKLPTVVTVQGGDGHWLGSCCGYHRAVMHVILTYAGEVVVGSESFAQQVRAANRLRRQLCVVRGATDPSLFRPLPAQHRARLRRRYQIPREAQVVLYHGRLDRRKGIVDLVGAVARLKEENRRIWFVLSGVGPDEKLLERLLARKRLTDQVRMLGYTPHHQARRVYALADVFCVPSYGEGFPNTILEAMACKIPVISTRVVGVRDVFGDTPAVRLVDARNPIGLAQALASVLNDKEYQRVAGEAGRKLVLERYRWHRVIGEYLRIYRRLMAESPSTGRWRLPRPTQRCPFREKQQLL